LLQSTLSARIAYGLGKAADIVGNAQAQYRPTTANAPVAGSPLRMLTCAFDNSPTFIMRSTALPGHPFSVLLGDPSLVQAGDFIIGDDTHFVARVEPLRPALCILCNQVVNILNPDVTSTAGTNAYGGRTADTDTTIAQGWPVSMLLRTRTDTEDARLPGDIKAGSFSVSCPVIPGVLIEYGMRLQDANAQDYTIIGAELSPFGWSLLAELATT
jgi:hypothetical protein